MYDLLVDTEHWRVKPKDEIKNDVERGIGWKMTKTQNKRCIGWCTNKSNKGEEKLFQENESIKNGNNKHLFLQSWKYFKIRSIIGCIFKGAWWVLTRTKS